MAASLNVPPITYVTRSIGVSSREYLFREVAQVCCDYGIGIHLTLLCTECSSGYNVSLQDVADLKAAFTFPMNIFVERIPGEQETAAAKSPHSGMVRGPEAVPPVR